MPQKTSTTVNAGARGRTAGVRIDPQIPAVNAGARGRTPPTVRRVTGAAPVFAPAPAPIPPRTPIPPPASVLAPAPAPGPGSGFGPGSGPRSWLQFPVLAPAPVLALVLLLTPAFAAQGQEPTLWSVLVRATLYVEDLHAQLSGVVMEERYQQRATLPGTFRRNEGVALQRATLRSDYLLVQPEGAERHFGFRDVFEANGGRVRDRDERLAQLFLDGASSVDRQVQGILADSARYNVGDVQRNMNTPTLPLLFLRRSYKARFEFERVSDRAPSLEIDGPEREPDVWVIAYTETAPDTVIRRRNGVNLPARGRYWIEPATGRVSMTELLIEDETVDATITVRYAQPAELDHPVPVEMRELYLNHLSGSRVEGSATYSRFRRFRVVVEESEPFRD